MDPYHRVVDERGEDIGKQDGEHHAFRKGGVGNPDQRHHETDEQAVNPAAFNRPTLHRPWFDFWRGQRIIRNYAFSKT